MISEMEIEKIFGRQVHLSEQLLDSVLKFTLAFSYAEHKLMGGRASTTRAKEYAATLQGKGYFDFEHFRQYFQNRYHKEKGFEAKLSALCNGDNHSYNQIRAAFNELSSELDMLEALFRICIRLRNNLFHGEKWSYMLADQENNLDMATEFMTRVLRHGGF